MIVKKHRRITEGAYKKLEVAKINTISVEAEDLLGKYLARDVVDPETGEVVAEFNDEVTEKFLEEIKRSEDRNLRDSLHRQHQCQFLAPRYPGDGPDRTDPGGEGEIACWPNQGNRSGKRSPKGP